MIKLPADLYSQMEKCTLLYNTLYWVTKEYVIARV